MRVKLQRSAVLHCVGCVRLASLHQNHQDPLAVCGRSHMSSEGILSWVWFYDAQASTFFRPSRRRWVSLRGIFSITAAQRAWLAFKTTCQVLETGRRRGNHWAWRWRRFGTGSLAAPTWQNHATFSVSFHSAIRNFYAWRPTWPTSFWSDNNEGFCK